MIGLTPPSRAPTAKPLRVIQVVLVAEDQRTATFPVVPPKRLAVPATGLRIFVLGDRAYLTAD